MINHKHLEMEVECWRDKSKKEVGEIYAWITSVTEAVIKEEKE